MLYNCCCFQAAILLNLTSCTVEHVALWCLVERLSLFMKLRYREVCAELEEDCDGLPFDLQFTLAVHVNHLNIFSIRYTSQHIRHYHHL